MASDLNQCNFIGRLGKDPETRFTPSGEAVCNFSLAVGESWKDKSSGEKKEKTEWVTCSVFGKLAEIAGQYLSKGKQVFVSGKFQTRKYQDKDGVDRYATSINVQTLQMIGGKDESETAPAPAPRQAPKPAPKSSTGFDEFDDSVPF